MHKVNKLYENVGTIFFTKRFLRLYLCMVYEFVILFSVIGIGWPVYIIYSSWIVYVYIYYVYIYLFDATHNAIAVRSKMK